jgi:hypothetical protein
MHDPQDDGSPPFILDAVAIGEEGDFVSCGEDASVNVWSGGVRKQSLRHPCSVWAVAALPGGDFATAGHDGVVRVFSCDALCTSLPSVEALHASFEADVAEVVERKRKGAGPSVEDLAKAPKWELRGGNPGRSEGQVGVFNKDGKLIAAQWLAASGSWIEVGEVLGNTGDGGLVHGQQYDHIMPVELETANGVVELKLGYNNGENPFHSAQRFIEQNNLPQTYLGQIADFIINRSGQQSAPTFDLSNRDAGLHTGTTYPSSSSSSASSCASSNTGGGHHSSFTSSSGLLGSTPSTSTGTSPSSCFPVMIYSYYADVAPAAKVLAKIREINADSGVLSESDLSNISSLMSTLEATSYYHSSEVTRDQLLSMLRMAVWGDPTAADADAVRKRFFICLDICRMACMHPSAADILGSAARGSSRSAIDADIVSGLRNVVHYGLDHVARAALPGASNVTDASVLSYLRMLCNFFKTPALAKMILNGWLGIAESAGSAHANSVMDEIASVPHSRLMQLCRCGKTTRGALSSLVLNALVYVATEQRNSATKSIDHHTQVTVSRCIGLSEGVLEAETEVSEPATKCLLALGTAGALIYLATRRPHGLGEGASHLGETSAVLRDAGSRVLSVARKVGAPQRELIGHEKCDLYTHEIEQMLQ